MPLVVAYPSAYKMLQLHPEAGSFLTNWCGAEVDLLIRKYLGVDVWAGGPGSHFSCHMTAPINDEDTIVTMRRDDKERGCPKRRFYEWEVCINQS